MLLWIHGYMLASLQNLYKRKYMWKLDVDKLYWHILVKLYRPNTQITIWYTPFYEIVFDISIIFRRTWMQSAICWRTCPKMLIDLWRVCSPPKHPGHENMLKIHSGNSSLYHTKKCWPKLSHKIFVLYASKFVLHHLLLDTTGHLICNLKNDIHGTMNIDW